MNPILRTLLCGVFETNCPLHVLQGHLDGVIRKIWDYVYYYYARNITTEYLTFPDYQEEDMNEERHTLRHIEINENFCAENIGTVKFPPPKGININMMPFILGDKKSLPGDYVHYWPLIEACGVEAKRKGKVGYLTIHESKVSAGKTQRRPGLHTEAPGLIKNASFSKFYTRWGTGARGESRDGGIYMASNIADSCQYWNVKVEDKIIDTGGSVEHLREFLDMHGINPETMSEDTIYWITDTTPHEALPVNYNSYRQFFRLVAGDVSVWYDKHSTKNSLGILPAAKILQDDKFKG